MHSNKLPGIDVKFKGNTAAGATVIDLDYTIPDGGCHSIVAAVLFGAIDIQTNTPPQIILYQADVSDYSDKEAVTDLTQTIVAGMANKQVLLELIKPTKKYIRLSVIRTGASNAIVITEQMIMAFHGRVTPLALGTVDYVRDYAVAPYTS